MSKVKKDIEKRFEELKNICIENKIPLFMSAVIDPCSNKTITVAVTNEVLGLKPQGKDYVSDCIKIFRGFTPVLENEVIKKASILSTDELDTISLDTKIMNSVLKKH